VVFAIDDVVRIGEVTFFGGSGDEGFFIDLDGFEGWEDAPELRGLLSRLLRLLLRLLKPSQVPSHLSCQNDLGLAISSGHEQSPPFAY